jgi:hypothetical protein
MGPILLSAPPRKTLATRAMECYQKQHHGLPMSPARLRLILFPGSLLAGLGVGMAWRQAPGPPSLDHPPGSVEESAHVPPTPSSAPAPPFSMERFHASAGLEMHRLLAQVLPGADAALVRALADELSQREPKPQPDPVWQAVFARWMQLEPPAAMAWAREHNVNETAMTAWVEIDVEAAMAATKPSARDSEWSIILTKISSADPLRAMQLNHELVARKDHPAGDGWGLFFDHLGASLLQKLAERDPSAALVELTSHFPNDQEAIKAIAAGWASKDPAACHAWIAQLSPDSKKAALASLAEAAAENPAKIAEALTGLPMDATTRSTCMSVAQEWAKKEPAAALAWVRTRFPAGPQLADALMQVANGLMETDLPAAVALMDEIGWKDHAGLHVDSSRRILPEKDGLPDKTEIKENNDFGEYDSPYQIMARLLDRLATTNPQDAIRVWGKAPAGLQSDLAGDIMVPWFRKDPTAAMAWLGGLPAGKVTPSYLETLVGNLVGVETDDRKNWALRLPPGPLQQAFAKTVATDLAQKAARSGPEALAAAAGAIPFTDAGSRHAALEVIVEKWGELDPVPALASLMHEATPSPETCQSVVAAWTMRDATAASEWVATQPPGPNRDGAIKGLVATLTNIELQPDFPAALAWSLALSDPVQRLKAAQAIFENPADPGDVEELRTTLDQTTALPEAERSALLGKLPP